MATNFVSNGKSYWRTVASYGRDINGKIRKQNFLGGNRKEAERKRQMFDAVLSRGIDFDDSTKIFKALMQKCKIQDSFTLDPHLIDEIIASYYSSKKIESTQQVVARTFEDAMHSWLFDVHRVSDSVKASSFESYECKFRLYIKGWEFARLPIEQVTSNQLQKHYNLLSEEHGKTYNVIKETNKLIRAFFNYEILQERLTVNPASSKKISLPGSSDQKIRTEIMNPHDLSKFIKSLNGHKFEAMFLFCIGTGVRIGEVIALKIPDLDLEKGVAHIRATQYSCNVFDANGDKSFKSIRSSTKNRLSRDIPIPANIIPLLQEYLLKRKKHRFKMGSAFVEQDYVFPDLLGGPLNYSNIRKEYVKIVERAEIPFKRIHSLRHLYASMLSHNGAVISNIQELLGHTTIITTQVYIHTDEESKRKDVDTLKII